MLSKILHENETHFPQSPLNGKIADQLESQFTSLKVYKHKINRFDHK